MRFIFTILLLIIFFLAGAVYGMNSANNVSTANLEETIQSEDVNVTEEKQKEIVVYPSAYEQVEEDQPMSITESIASGLEAIVSTFYDGVVHVLYAISEQFF